MLNIEAEEILKYAYKYTLIAGQRMRIVSVQAMLILQILTGVDGKSFQRHFLAVSLLCCTVVMCAGG